MLRPSTFLKSRNIPTRKDYLDLSQSSGKEAKILSRGFLEQCRIFSTYRQDAPFIPGVISVTAIVEKKSPS
jgi:hypothetical protein